MRGYCYLFFLLVLSFAAIKSGAQNMAGQVIELESGNVLAAVDIRNIHRGTHTISDTEGKFTIEAETDDLLEFSKEGYKTYRVRVPPGNLSQFFKIGLDKPKPALKDFLTGIPQTYRDDSLKYSYLYKRELEFPKMSTIEMLKHPFSAMSKRSRQIWAFQEEFEWFQKEKYIRYTFSENLVTSLTGLKDDSLQMYMLMFRPDYEQLRNMSEYALYGYVKKTVELYRQRGPRARMSPTRSSR